MCRCAANCCRRCFDNSSCTTLIGARGLAIMVSAASAVRRGIDTPCAMRSGNGVDAAGSSSPLSFASPAGGVPAASGCGQPCGGSAKSVGGGTTHSDRTSPPPAAVARPRDTPVAASGTSFPSSPAVAVAAAGCGRSRHGGVEDGGGGGIYTADVSSACCTSRAAESSGRGRPSVGELADILPETAETSDNSAIRPQPRA